MPWVPKEARLAGGHTKGHEEEGGEVEAVAEVEEAKEWLPPQGLLRRVGQGLEAGWWACQHLVLRTAGTGLSLGQPARARWGRFGGGVDVGRLHEVLPLSGVRAVRRRDRLCSKPMLMMRMLMRMLIYVSVHEWRWSRR